MYKAATGGGDGGWPEHESPFIRRLIELFTERGLTQIDAVRRELDDWIAGNQHQPTERRPAPPGQVERWTAEELRLVRVYLQAVPPSQFTPEDWSMLVDYLAQRYLPRDFALQAADWMAAKTTVMGKVEALAADMPAEDAERLALAAPETPGAADALGLNDYQRAVMRYGRQRCAENIQGLTDTLRSRMKRVILDHQEGEFLGDKAKTAESLRTKLLDEFGTLNRDWRRIAMTEAAENSNQGYIAAVGTGAKVKRLEAYDGACGFCRKINGREFAVVSPAKADKDPDTEVWVGKTNIGRSASPMKRVDGELVPREEDELWWPAAGAQHPHCRGRWLTVKETNTAGDDDFQAWMKAKLAATRPKRGDDDEE
ncbi:MAG TPA: hypothetical protein VFX91_00620 [Alcanivorax sp.]|nr:hypothetical protein [Alcanivorax sp.]